MANVKLPSQPCGKSNSLGISANKASRIKGILTGFRETFGHMRIKDDFKKAFNNVTNRFLNFLK